MAFWGVEVKPGKPYTHRHNPSHGRLRICQATLGNCDVPARTLVQCNVGNKTPIILCSLNPRLAEMCHLEIELEEDEEVVFSVLGKSSVHLSGYYIRSSSGGNAGDDESESHGEDIGEDDTDEEYDASEDKYESDFIDDGEVAAPEDKYDSDFIDDDDVVVSPSCRHKKEAFDKLTANNAKRRRLKKKNQTNGINDNNDVSPCKPAVRRNGPSIFDSGSEDEVSLPISASLSNKDIAKIDETSKPPNVTATDETGKKSDKRKRDAVSQDPASTMDVTDTSGSLLSKQGEIKRRSKRKEDRKRSHKIRTLENGLVIEDLSTGTAGAKEASNGSKISINYVGMLQDGKIIDSNTGKKPFKFKLGSGKVTKGWDLGICGMRVGEKRRLTIPPSMGCGDLASQVPENAPIIYEIELLKVRNQK